MTINRPVMLAVTLCTMSITGFVKATITPLQSLNFGTITVTNNNFVSSLSIDPAGNAQVVGGIAIIVPGNHAIYELSDLPSNRRVNVDVIVINAQMIASAASEETFQFSVIQNTSFLNTDLNGTALLFIGGRITTSGSGVNRFSDTQFNSTIQVSVNF